jgi:hypothetical protein
VLTLAIACLLGAPADAFPVTPLRAAVETARQENRLVLAEFWTFDAEPSRSYAAKVLGQEPVLVWLAAHGIGARVNTDFNKKLAERFVIKETPTLLVLDGQLALWGRIAGPRSPQDIAAALAAIVADRRAFLEAQERLPGDPANAVELSKLLRGYVRQENGREAEAILGRLRAADPAGAATRPEVLAFAIGDAIYEPRKQLDEAIRVYYQAAEWAKSRNREIREQALFRLANLKLFAHEPEKTVELLELLLKESPEFPERSKAMYVLGITCCKEFGPEARDRIEKGKKILAELGDTYADRFAVEAEKFLDSIDKMQEK